MKNLIIAGVSRAGKSTLAKDMAQKYKLTYIPFDSIVSTLEELYPCTKIAHYDNNKIISKDIAILLNTFIKHLNYEDINYVIDMYQIYPIDLSKILDLNTHLAIYLGYSSLSSHNKLCDIRKYARDKDWTKNTSDIEMLSILDKFILEDKMIKQECKLVNYPYYDTGSDFLMSLQDASRYIDLNIK